jgi:hypothetical protein
LRILRPAEGDVLRFDGRAFVNTATTPTQSATIASGAVTVSGPSVTLLTVDTESAAASDDLATISGGTAGQLLAVKAANAARTVTIVATGNIDVQSAGGDFPLDNSVDVWTGVYDGAAWLEVTRSNNAA